MSNLIATAMDATDCSPTASLLIMRIVFWSRFAKVMKNGKVWVAKSAADWCEETRLTKKQHNDAIARLKRLGLVETEQHLFGNKNITHVRLTDKGGTLFRPFQGTPDAFPDGSTDLSPTGELYIKGETTGRDNKGDTCSGEPNEGSSLPEEVDGKDQAQELIMIKKPSHSVKDVVAQKVDPKSKPKHKNPVTQLAEEWRDRVGETGEFVPAFTSKQMGQFKLLLQKAPKGVNVRRSLRNALVDWPGFVNETKYAKGLKAVPDKPNIGFMLAHADVLFNFQKTTGETVSIVKDDPLAGLQKVSDV